MKPIALIEEAIDALVATTRQASKIPGLATAIVDRRGVLFARGYGYRDLATKLPLTTKTIYPIASTSKAINATLLGMLVDEGRLSWDRPVQEYLPRFYLGNAFISSQVNLSDLVTMRTGLAPHQWMWMDHPITRPELVERLRYLELSAGFRERYQYNNLTVAVAGHVAEIVTGESWQALVQRKILTPLSMTNTSFRTSISDVGSRSYHENNDRELIPTRRVSSEVTAPAGGSIHSTIEDMALWTSFNLNCGKVDGTQLLTRETMQRIHAPQVMTGADPSPPSPNAAYAMGWFVDSYKGCPRLSHGGYLHDVSSEIMLFPEQGIGILSFLNFGSARLVRPFNERVFDLLMGFSCGPELDARLAQYEADIAANRQRRQSVRRVPHAPPSHALSDYVGLYAHPGYGTIAIEVQDQQLWFKRHAVTLPLEHWHYDTWVAGPNDWFEIYRPHVLDPLHPLRFETDIHGDIAAVHIPFEPTVTPIRFVRQ